MDNLSFMTLKCNICITLVLLCYSSHCNITDHVITAPVCNTTIMLRYSWTRTATKCLADLCTLNKPDRWLKDIAITMSGNFTRVPLFVRQQRPASSWKWPLWKLMTMKAGYLLLLIVWQVTTVWWRKCLTCYAIIIALSTKSRPVSLVNKVCLSEVSWQSYWTYSMRSQESTTYTATLKPTSLFPHYSALRQYVTCKAWTPIDQTHRYGRP